MKTGLFGNGMDRLPDVAFMVMSALRELSRISKPSGFLFIDNGHQSRHEAREKIIASKKWKIIEDNKRFMKCQPIL